VGLDVPPTVLVGSLGVGQRQMVEIAKALRRDVSLLILDEPTSALNETEVERLMETLRELRRRGVSCIYISHKLDELFEITDRITVLRDGQVVGTARTDRKSTRLNSSHVKISYAVFCLKKKKKKQTKS